MTTNRQHRSALIAIAAAVVAALVPAPAAAQDDTDAEAAVTWGVTPSTQDGPDGRAAFDYELEPGDTVVDFAGVSNFSAEPISVDVYASDAYTTETGAFDLLPSEQESTDVGAWIGFNERRLTIEPETRLDVPFAITVPPDATPGDHVGGVVAAVTETATDAGGDEVAVERRVGARIHLRIAGDLDPVLAPDLDEETFHYEWSPIEPGRLSFDYTVANTGNVRLAGTLVARVAGPWGVLPREVVVGDLPQILPGDTYAGSAAVADTWPAMLLDVELRVSPEAVDDADAEVRLASRTDDARLWAPPWPQFAIAAALALAVWAVVKVRRRPGAGKGRTDAESSIDAGGEPRGDRGSEAVAPATDQKEPAQS